MNEQEDYDLATWNQDAEEVQQWIDEGCPWPIPGRARKAIDRQHDWLREVWRDES